MGASSVSRVICACAAFSTVFGIATDWAEAAVVSAAKASNAKLAAGVAVVVIHLQTFCVILMEVPM